MSSHSHSDDDLSVAENKMHSDESITNSTSDYNAPASSESELAREETRAVFRLRLLILLVLVVAAVAISVVVYEITSHADETQFEVQYNGLAAKVLSSFNEIVGLKIGAIASLGVECTTFARSLNETWPFVTLNDFQERAASARSLSKALFLELLPVVTDKTRKGWEAYALENKGWLDEGRAYQDKLKLGLDGRRLKAASLTGKQVLGFVTGANNGSSVIADHIFILDKTWAPVVDPGPGPYFPIWQSSPILSSPRDLVNYNLLGYPSYAPYIRLSYESGQIAIGGIDTSNPGDVTNPSLPTSFFAFILSFAAHKLVNYTGDPMSSVYIPVFDSFEPDRKTVAVIVAVINWASYFEEILPPNSPGVVAILENSCQGQFTFKVTGSEVQFIGKGDFHSPSFSHFLQYSSFKNLSVFAGAQLGYSLNQDKCVYKVSVYPSQELYDEYHTNLSVIVTFSVALVFLFTVVLFVVYDCLVERRQRIVMTTAVRSNAIVSSIFPKQIRDQLFADSQVSPIHGTKTMLRSFLSGSDNVAESRSSKPIADLFPDASVIFADIVGFTAWSSVREPCQVFVLLETLYKAFDEIATSRRVFKIETVGDCYVAVAGVPDPCKNHAVVMARFAADCLAKMSSLTKELETTLGPDTGDLRLRVGIHSGPVTAGVLRGERSRFQLFGDTMNTASRMESTGEASKIHTSQETADLLCAAGKENWIVPREDLVYAKGKGHMQTYWIVLGKTSGSVASRRDSTDGEDLDDEATTKDVPRGKDFRRVDASDDDSGRNRRLVEWNVDILARVLKQIIARRRARKISDVSTDIYYVGAQGATVLDEVCEIITLPQFDARAARRQEDPETIELGDAVLGQLHNFVATIASLYRDNPFHSFEHASHVAMSVVKLLSRIIAPSDLDFEDGSKAHSTLHDHTYGITSDPLTQFSCVLSALIHDVDHQGVPNVQLVKEGQSIATAYGGKSVAEQNSVDLSWVLLMDPKYKELRAAIYCNEEEMCRFRQLVVNSVMATDIVDKELKELRNLRWEKAFKACNDEGTAAATNRKATIVIEHLIQASDVSHTMQHWNIYRKWNQRLFEEMYRAYKEGRAETDPSTNWYKGEIGFFDFYIIPLAKKLRECGVFGVSSDEYLNYAMQNRKEWEARGQEVVAEMLEKVKNSWHSIDGSPEPSAGTSGPLLEI